MKIFRTRVGPELLWPVVTLITLLNTWFFSMDNWPGIFVLMLALFFLIYLIASTRYLVKGNILTIQCGVFYREDINIQSIHRITEVTDLFAAPAISIYRLQIIYSDNKSVAISPKEIKEFLECLRSVNPYIVVQLKNKNDD